MKHDQKPYTTKKPWVCDECKFGGCSNCIDVLRSVYTDELLCQCKRPEHFGESRSNQIEDPFTGDVHGPGAVISKDGGVKIDEEFIREWAKQFE